MDVNYCMFLCLFAGIVFMFTVGTPKVDDPCTEDAACQGLTHSTCSKPANKCSCDTDFFSSPNKETCEAKIELNAVCTENIANQCKNPNSECRTDNGALKCLCKATHFVQSSGCVERIVVGGTCVAAERGCIKMADCNSTSLKCECKAGLMVKADKTCGSSGLKLTIKVPSLIITVLLSLMYPMTYL